MRALQVLLHCKIYSHFRVEFALDFQSPPPQFFQDDPLFCALKNCSHFIFSRPTRIQSHFQISHALDTLKLHHFPCPARSTKKKEFRRQTWKSYNSPRIYINPATSNLRVLSISLPRPFGPQSLWKKSAGL